MKAAFTVDSTIAANPTAAKAASEITILLNEGRWVYLCSRPFQFSSAPSGFLQLVKLVINELEIDMHCSFFFCILLFL
jgi:hypothetical protein